MSRTFAPPPSGTMPTDASAINQYLQGVLPQWLKTAPPTTFAALRSSLARHRLAQQQVHQLLRDLPSLDSFAKPLLADAMRKHFNISAKLDDALWREKKVRYEPPLFPVTELAVPLLAPYYESSNLLQRALQNFSEDQASDSEHYPGTGIVLHGLSLAPSPGAFARVCRALDLGGQYQRLLDAALPSDDSSSSLAPLQVLATNQRYGLLVQAHCSRLQGVIDETMYRVLLQLCKGTAIDNAEESGLRLRCRQMKVQGHLVVGALLLELTLAPGLELLDERVVRQVVLYLPGDPERPLRSFASWSAATSELQCLLAKAQWRRYFLGLLGIDDRQRLLVELTPMLKRGSVQVTLDGVSIDQPLFQAMARQQIRQIKRDAASLAVPTAEADRQAYRERMRFYKALGETLLGVAVSFIPGVGELMLASMVGHILEEVFEGVRDWNQGQREQALDHLLDIVENVAASAVLVAGGTAVVKVLARQPFVEQLVPVCLDNGARRLWHQDLVPYLAENPPPSYTVRSDGLRQADGKLWLAHARGVFRVAADPRSGRWCLLHGRRSEAYAPHLENNGQGGWLLPGEQPLQWSSLADLVRRQSNSDVPLSEQECQDAVAIADIDEAQLRGLLVANRRPPVELQEILVRFGLDARIERLLGQLRSGTLLGAQDAELFHLARELFASSAKSYVEIIARLRQQLPQRSSELFDRALASGQPVIDVAGQVLQRDFPGLSARHVQALIEQAGTSQRETLISQGRVPLALAERARLAVRRARMDDALLGLRLRHGYRRDAVRLAFSLLRRLPAWPQGLSFELREGSAFGRTLDRLLAQGETRETRILLRGPEGFEVLGGEGGDLEDAAAPVADFLEAICLSLSTSQREALGWQPDTALLRRRLYTQAMAERGQLDRLIGLGPRPFGLRVPRRQADGRIGYAMSGRGAVSRTSLTGVVRELFPAFDNNQAEAFLQRLGDGTPDVLSALAQYQDQYRSLDVALNTWQNAASAQAQGLRRRIGEILRRCWRRQSERVYEVDGSIAGYRLRINDIPLDDLPTLPAGIDFSHVVDVNLAGTDLTLQNCQLLEAFTGAHWLDLSDCRLTDVPEAVMGMSSLTHLNLENNRIRLSNLGAMRLDGLERLASLNLDRNPVGEWLDLSQLRELREVMLRATGLHALPDGLLSRPFLEMADLRENQISELPDSYYSAPLRTRLSIILHDNPLTAETRGRLDSDDEPRQHISVEEGRRTWLAAMGSELRSERDGWWRELQVEPGSADFFRLLSDMTQTAEFQRAYQDLEARVWRMVEAVRENLALRQELFTLAASPTTCIDSVTSVFSNLELRLQLFLVRTRTQAQNVGRDLLGFARRLFRLDQVERWASRAISDRLASGRAVDEVEVSLAYRTGLARELDLPGQPRHMQFAEIANVTSQELEATKRAVAAAEASDQLGEFIGTRDFWVEYLREQHGPAFVAVEDDFWARLEVVSARQHTLPEGEYLSQMNQLAGEREEALQALAVRLTREELAREAG